MRYIFSAERVEKERVWRRKLYFITAGTAVNIFKGYLDGTFRPNAPVTRAEFAAIISTGLPKQPSSRPAITFTFYRCTR
ncbi:S-layer homology domain-containing protein [Nostoc sp.]|uniref:S-layer homology domain-containing protein n=1 Tax=Nostoc sp. TaxID=1180 RepID=UPI003FA5AB92